MKDNTNKKGFAKWLETLQQESWQLELIISGFAIFLLLGAYDSIIGIDYKIEKLAIGYGNYGILRIPNKKDTLIFSTAIEIPFWKE